MAGPTANRHAGRLAKLPFLILGGLILQDTKFENKRRRRVERLLRTPVRSRSGLTKCWVPEEFNSRILTRE